MLSVLTRHSAGAAAARAAGVPRPPVPARALPAPGAHGAARAHAATAVRGAHLAVPAYRTCWNNS